MRAIAWVPFLFWPSENCIFFHCCCCCCCFRIQHKVKCKGIRSINERDGFQCSLARYYFDLVFSFFFPPFCILINIHFRVFDAAKQYSNRPLDEHNPIYLSFRYISLNFCFRLCEIRSKHFISFDLFFFFSFISLSLSLDCWLLSVGSLLSSLSVIWIKLERKTCNSTEQEYEKSVQNNWFCFQLHILTFPKVTA